MLRSLPNRGANRGANPVVKPLGTGMRLAFGLGAALVTVGFGTTAHAQARIAIVDMQRAVEGTTEGKSVLSSLTGEADKKKKELEGKRDELKKMSDDLQKQESVLKPDVFQKKRQELEQKAMQFQETVMRTEQEFQQKQFKVTQPIQQKVVAAISQIAAREKFTLVLRSDAVVWPQQSELDITNEVIRKANEIKAPAPAAAPAPATPGAPPKK
jgi:outer membrane protein